MKKLTKQEWIGVGVAVIATTFIFFGGSVWNFFFGASDAVRNIQGEAPQAAEAHLQNISTVEGLEIYDVVVGTGDEAVKGKTVVAHYVGFLTDGTQFDSSEKRGPYEFKLGARTVIEGWDEGLVGMKEGGVRRLVVSPELGYGSQPIGPIPANSTLIFDVQLVDVK